MIVNLKATHFKLTEPIRKFAEEKISALEKFTENLDVVRIELEKLSGKKTGEVFRAEVTIDAPHGMFRAESQSFDLYVAIDQVVPKIVRQIETYKHRTGRKVRISRRKVKEGLVS
jgi:putative sigma-54 modulation protein